MSTEKKDQGQREHERGKRDKQAKVWHPPHPRSVVEEFVGPDLTDEQRQDRRDYSSGQKAG